MTDSPPPLADSIYTKCDILAKFRSEAARKVNYDALKRSNGRKKFQGIKAQQFYLIFPTPGLVNPISVGPIYSDTTQVF